MTPRARDQCVVDVMSMRTGPLRGYVMRTPSSVTVATTAPTLPTDGEDAPTGVVPMRVSTALGPPITAASDDIAVKSLTP